MYTWPEIASVGMTEEEAKAAGREVRVGKFPFQANGRARAMAETDGMVHQLAACRDKNLALMDKLRGHLETRLDTFIARGEDPTIRWTQALTAMAKVEQNSLLLKDDAKRALVSRLVGGA